MTEQPQQAPGIEIPPSVLIEGYRQEIAKLNDIRVSQDIALNYANQVILALQEASTPAESVDAAGTATHADRADHPIYTEPKADTAESED